MTAISAHRGGGEHGPEGTYGAYRSALATGAEYVEFDIRRTAAHLDLKQADCAHSRSYSAPRAGPP